MSGIELKGKTALVTGAGRRLGADIALSLAAAGCDLIVHCAGSVDGASRVADEARKLGRRAQVVRADLTDPAQLARLVTESVAFGGGQLDVLVNNAGNFERVEPPSLTAEHWDRALLLNATVPYRLTIGLAAALRASRGCMVAIGCVSALRPWKNYVPYATSKAALVHLVKGLALALAPDVRVNAIAPGPVLLPASYNDAQRESLLRRIPLGRLGDAGDVSRAVLFMCTNDFVTGQVLAVDGGQSLG